MVNQMKSTLEEAQANLAILQNWAKAYANKSQNDEKYEIGDEMPLATYNLCINEHFSKKTWHRWIGPYQNAEVISYVACRLDLHPDWHIHFVFHVSNLKCYHRSEEFGRVERAPSPVGVNGEGRYELEAILRHKGNGARHMYQVLWKGYP